MMMEKEEVKGETLFSFSEGMKWFSAEEDRKGSPNQI
jgi:hypothetical protein